MHVDTHVVAWLYAKQIDLLRERVRRGVEDQEILVSPIVLLELDLLPEIGGIGVGGAGSTRTCMPESARSGSQGPSMRHRSRTGPSTRSTGS